MTTSPPNGGHSSTSVFNALGSYADRIRDSRRAGSALASNGSANPSTAASSSVSPSSTPATRSASGRADVSPAATSTGAARAAPLEDDGPWETVQSTRHKTKTKEEEKRSSGGSNSRDWRERPAAREQPEEPERRSTSSKPATRKPAAVGATATSSSAPAPVTRSAVSATGTKNAWGLPSTIARQTPTTQPAAEPTTKTDGPSPTVPTPPSPSIGETAATTTASIGSPNLSAETASSSTAPTSVMRADLEDDWRARPKQKEVESEQEEDKEQDVVPAVFRQAAPPPAINAWDTRKKALGTTSEPVAAATPHPHAEQAKPADATSAPIQFGTVTPQESTSALPVPNGEETGEGVKIVKKKKKGSATPVAPPVAVVPDMDASAFPDLAQAAEVARAVEEKKELAKAKKESEDGSAGDESGATAGKKPKWTPIPASELLAAADEAAEASRKQSREAAARKKAAAKRGESEPTSTSTSPATKGRRKETSEARGRGRSQRSVSGEEIRLPPQPQGSRGSSANFKPVFGSLQLSSDAGEESVELKRNAPAANGGYSAPLSRQTSRQSRPPSPRSRTQLPSPASQTVPLEGQYMRFGSGPYSHRPSNTAPLPQHPFTGGGSAGFPRPPGRGNGRSSFSHPRGSARGAFRGGHMAANKANMGPGPNGAPWSPTGGVAALPDTPFANGNQYQRGYGMGYQSMFPTTGPPQNFGQIMDPMQGYMGLGMYGRGGMPPAPMPQTSAPNLDPLRFYVLGQVEYYFSMQNLAMDFFLRQQMDSEGWIDIAMIASFNRIKSLTPDVAIVKEVMSVSSLLEVREEKVRLAGSEAQRWVLPDAKPSPWASSDPKSPAQVTSPHVHPHDPAFGVEEIPPAPKFVAADVENALMKSSAAAAAVAVAATSVTSDSTVAGTTATTVTSVPPSSSASLLNGDESVDKDTPATSTNGDHEGEVKAE